MSLDQWQEKIYDHFNLLDDFRSETNNKNPIFALEHGLNTSELDYLKADIRAYIATREPSNRHWLPWVVYATEIGYVYEGQEYWPTFESQTIGWTRSGYKNRTWMRKCFIRFRDEFHGLEPSGPWAGKFPNICWPIRHAILPHYLQHQLTQALFDMRLSFRSKLFESPLDLGDFIATHCRTGTKRFRELLEDPMLVGQLCIALLLQDNKISEELLLKETQVRIVADLSKEQMDRKRFESAQRQAITIYKGLHGQRAEGTDHSPHEQGTRLEEERFRIENKPKILLYPKASGKEYGVKLELQDLRSLAACFRNLEPIIAKHFCTITGTSGSPVPKGMFLRPGPHPIYPLIRWPSSNETLINFEDASPELESLLKMDQFIPSDEVHLFKISTDNIGYEIQEKHLRSNQKYVVISVSPITIDGEVFKSFNLQCDSVYSALIETSNEFTSHFEDAVKKIGLSCAKSLRVWPVGIPAKEWDEDGYGVWLVGDHIRFAIRADYELRGIELTINDDDPFFINIPESNCEPILLDMSFLPSGNNQIEVKAIAKYQPHDDHLVGYLNAIVREPQVRDVKTTNQGALKGFVYPENPSLEEVWANDINIEIYGPAGQTVGCKVRFFDSTNTFVIREKKITDLKLPILVEQWRNKFAACINKDELMQEAYDEAHSCELLFDVEEMGYFTVSGERKFTPIRWAIHKSGNHKKLRYINDTEVESVKISRYEFVAPDIFDVIDKIGHDQTVECDKGGLFLVQGVNDITDSIVMSPLVRKMTLNDMMIFPKLQKSYKWGEDIWRLIVIYDWWERGRTSGNILSDLWRKQVLKSILSTLCQVIGGNGWKNAELEYLEKRNDNNLFKLKICISDKSDEQLIGNIIERDAKNMADRSIIERKYYFENLFKKQIRSLVERYHTDYHAKSGTIIRKSPARFLPEFVLRLSSSPNTLLDWDKEKFWNVMKCLQEIPVIFRAGRYLVLAVENHYASKFDLNDCCSGWKWQ